MAKPPEKRAPFDPAKAMRDRAAAEGERPAAPLTRDQRWGKRPLLRPEPPMPEPPMPESKAPEGDDAGTDASGKKD